MSSRQRRLLRRAPGTSRLAFGRGQLVTFGRNVGKVKAGEFGIITQAKQDQSGYRYEVLYLGGTIWVRQEDLKQAKGAPCPTALVSNGRKS